VSELLRQIMQIGVIVEKFKNKIMINGFENYTEKLNEYESLELLPEIKKILSVRIGENKAILSYDIKYLLITSGYENITTPRIRKIINHIRINGLIVNLIAGKKGYWIEENADKRRQYVISIHQRASAMFGILKNIEI